MPDFVYTSLTVVFCIFFFFYILPLIYIMMTPTFGHFAKIYPLKKNDNELNSIYKFGEFKNFTEAKPLLKAKDITKILGMMLKKKSSTKPDVKIPVCKINQYFFENYSDDLQFAWLGHSCVLLKIDGKTILFDPSLSKFAYPFKFANKRFSDIPIDVEKFNNFDIVLYSHDHYEHIDYQTFKKIKNNTKAFVSPLEVASILDLWGLDKNKNIELDWWEEVEVEGIKIICTPSQHFSGRMPGKRNKTLW